MGVKWTKEQQKVIDLQNRNILVSAAAGSGKTAVLVERIIQMLTREENPVDVDRLLIVTFTDAAAAEMKERILGAIEKALEEKPGDVHLQKQATLIHSAPITTIHSFCLSVIRDHFHVIDIDPGFRIAEEGELKLLKQDVIEELLENSYSEGEESFLNMVEKLGTGRTDKKLESLILQLYEYSRSYPQPEKWLEQCVNNYKMDEVEGEYPVFLLAEKEIEKYLCDLIPTLEGALKICEEPDGPYMYGEMLESDIEMLKKLRGKNFRELGAELQKFKWKVLSRKKDESVSEEKKEQVKELRELVKSQIKGLVSTYFYGTPEELIRDMEQSYETMQEFTKLVKLFAEAFSEKKKKRNLIDFSDMEQFARRILTEEKDGELVPSIVAKEYQEQFVEVMIDEYQDSNLIQEAILTSVSTVSTGRNNIFMVGDVKQSIYRFRLSRPELFMEKYNTYTQEDGEKQRIDLHKNFRSREEVLDATNYVFRKIMREELGGVEYDDQTALYLGADYEPILRVDGTSQHIAELLLVDPIDEEQSETTVVANRIKELIQTARVKDKETGLSRPVRYRDIVILTRSIKGWADVFAADLNEVGIPAYAGSQSGYFETYEVSVLLDYLRILDNQCQDMPLAAVLTSPFVGMDAQQLADIRNADPEVPFYEAARKCPQLETFFAQLEAFRECVPYTPIHELLWKILDETGYGIYISAMPGGEQRKANLEMLVEKAAVFEGTSYKGLFNFVRYIEQLKKYDIDYGEANITDEQADTVRIMSIHKSKGLEFPIVFVVGTGKRFNTQDVNGSVIIHPELGVGIDYVDLERRTKAPTFLKKMIQQQTMQENLGEELRVLYVAMTRAKEKLILTGKLKNAQLTVCGYEEDAREGISFYELVSARSYLDWILPAVTKADAPFEIRIWNDAEESVVERAEEQAESVAKDILENWNTSKEYHKPLKEHLQKQFEYQYPYMQDQNLKLKFTVSELKKRAYLEEESGEIAYEEAEVIPLMPRFLQEEESLTGASRGSAYHKVLELLDFSREYDKESIQEAIDELESNQKISKEMAECIRIDDLLRLLQSNTGKRVRNAAKRGLLRKEQPFVLGVDAKEFVLEDDCSTEWILVQGIIDVYFEEDGELVVLDYKTDRVRNVEELQEKYHAQLDYYAKALEQLLKKKVKEKIIYSFHLGKEVIDI